LNATEALAMITREGVIRALKWAVDLIYIILSVLEAYPSGVKNRDE